MSANLPQMSNLTPGAKRLVDAAQEIKQIGKADDLLVQHWLMALLDRHFAMVEDLLPGVNLTELRNPKNPSSQMQTTLDAETLIQQGVEQAQKRANNVVTERDLAVCILNIAGFTVAKPAHRGPISLTSQLSNIENPDTFKQPTIENMPTPTLDHYGYDLTGAAQMGQLTEIIGRQDEQELLVETLCRRTKRNPALIGPAGVGKTAIVEGLAQRIVRGDVPKHLSGVRLISLQPSTLVAGAQHAGELEKRMQAIVREASQPGVILFIDEIHTIIGSGGIPGLSDLASILKPALARGNLACIAATTAEEYRRFIEPDTALERRFQPIRVQEMTPEQAYSVLQTVRTDLSKLKDVQVGDDVLSYLVEFGHQYMRNRHFPDKAVDLLEQSFAYAIAHNQKEVNLYTAQRVAQRMISMPLSLAERFQALEERLFQRGLLPGRNQEQLMGRLQVTLRGLDIRSTRPNAVILLVGEASKNAESLAESIAEALFGSVERVVAVNLERMVHPADISLLVGAPPGYIGYSDELPLHRLSQIPWCVLRFDGIDGCHPQIRRFIARALEDGSFTDGRGKTIYLSDTVVILTAGTVSLATQYTLGFQSQRNILNDEDVRQIINNALGDDLLDQVDVLVQQSASVPTSFAEWLEKNFLVNLQARFTKLSVSLEWDESLLEWFAAQQETGLSEREWEELFDKQISPAIARHLPPETSSSPVSLKIGYRDGRVNIQKIPTD